MDDDPKGWDEPRLGVLRFVAGVVLLFLLVWLVVVREPTDTVAVGTILGSLLILLGFEAGLRWPPR